MSTSSSSAQNDLNVALPSCSYETILCDDVLDAIFSRLPQVSTVTEALKLRRVNHLACKAINRTLSREDTLKIDIHESNLYKIVGMNRVKLSEPEPVIFIQKTRINAVDSVEALEFLIGRMKVLRNLEINMDDGDSTHLNKLLRAILNAENVRLESLKVRRRPAKMILPLIADLVRKHDKTLKTLGRLGLQEAAMGLTKEINLDRLSLMTFDLGLEASYDKIYQQLINITGTGALFKHLSYTSFIGFDPTDEVIQNMLATTCVESLRLTMVKGPHVYPKPDYMIGKVRRIKELQLGEVVERPSYFHSLRPHEKIYKKVFPHVDDVHYFQHWQD